MKAHAIANFLAKLTTVEKVPNMIEEWKIFLDGSVSKKGPGIGVVAIGPNQEKNEHAKTSHSQ